ncbi:hypothetical protein PV327_004842 [Microctonus hyperodae]|uniref:C2H2-type domain-containing protein n=1 Tax=Microctonus hyperodae TaxID=165561 RepID=A0AA39FDF6_MICHY|nr:hypothetical protein PV327_004842 [Microctonus hyperodae]
MDDEYGKKFAEMQKYIPFLEAMIERLQRVPDESRKLQLNKMQQLHGILSSSKKKLKIETLQRCEDVLQKLYSKVEKGTSAGLNFPVKEVDGQSAEASHASTSTSDNTSRQPNESIKVNSSKKMDETPASPTPPASPDITSKSIVTSPIMIPTERSHDYSNDKADSKPASPEHSETFATKEPIIIPTERKNEWSEHSSQNVNPHNVSKMNNYGSHKINDSKLYQRPIQSATNSTTGTRSFSASEKNRSDNNRLEDDQDVIELDSPNQNRLTSPEPRKMPKTNPTSLLASPPPELNAPPLSKEDLAELLNESSEGNPNKTLPIHGEKDIRNRGVRDKLHEESRKSENDKKSVNNSTVNNTNVDMDNERRWEEIDKHIVKLTPRKNLPSTGIINTTGVRVDAPRIELKSQLPSSNHPSLQKKSVDIRNSSVSPSTKNSERSAEPRYTDSYERHPRHSRDSQNDVPNISMPDMNVIKSAFSRLSEGDIANLVQTNLQIQTENFLHADERNSFQRRLMSDQNKQRPAQPGHNMSTETPDFRRENPEFYDMHQHSPRHHQPSGAGVGYPSTGQWNLNPNVRSHMHGPELSPRQQYQQHPNNVQHQEMWTLVQNPVSLDNHPPHHNPNQFGPVPNRGIRPLMNPLKDPNFTEDIPLTPPSLPPAQMIPPLMSSPTFVNSPYRGFPQENRPFEQPFDRSSEFQHGPPRPQWDHQPNRGNEPAFDRPGEYPHVPPRQTQWDQLPNRPHDVPFERPIEFPQNEYPPRPTHWEHETNYHDGSRGRGMNENCYGRPTNVEPPLWGRSCGTGPEGPNRNNERGRGNERFPNERNRPGESSHSNFSRSRPSEWDRPPQNESLNRYRDRDPRCRQESTNQSSNVSVNIPSASIPRRDPRLSKDNPQPSPTTKPKEAPIPVPPPKPKDPPPKPKDPPPKPKDPPPKPKDPSPVNKRDPRRHSADSRDSSKSKSSSQSSHKSRNKSSEKPRESSKHNSGKSKKDSTDHKSSSEKPKDVETMQSPLESLYGVVDTAAKTGKGYGLQKFKIPKIRRSETIVPRPPTPPKSNKHARDEDVDWNADPVRSPIPANADAPEKNKNQYEEKKMEVTSTTEEINDPPITVTTAVDEHDPKVSETVTTSKEVPIPINESEKIDNKLEENKTAVETLGPVKNSESGLEPVQESQLKETVTQELIESLIRKSLESGEGKKLFEQAKLLQRLGEALDPKKYKKIQKIINADSESGSSDKEDTTIKKVVSKKKRRVIVSDSSDEECLADRLSITEQEKRRKITKDKKSILEDEEMEVDEIDTEKENKNYDEDDNNDEDAIVTEVEKSPKKQRKTKKAKVKKSSEIVIEEPEEQKEQVPKRPGRIAKKRRNSLEMLQEDIREMFISEGVVTATGHRMCRLIKEAEGNLPSINSDGKGGTAPPVYVSSSPDRHNNDVQSDEDEVNVKSRARSKAKTNKNFDSEKPVKSKLKTRKGRKRAVKSSKEIIGLSSDSEDEQPSSPLRNNKDSSINEMSDDAKGKNTSNKSLSPMLDANSDDFGPTLRRSERVALKEPRVLIEKADLSKIDSSKIMFDISSDESFGIDVSELTAAVDISLHPERRSTDDGNESITSLTKKISDKIPKSRKKNTNESNDRKSDTPVTFDDDVSVTSDVSISSSNISNTNKKNLSSSLRADANKEIIGNMLGNLSDDKIKHTSNINLDKESDFEIDEDKDNSTMDDNKKPLAKSKKKRCRWQMGIVPKKKKKSGNNAATDSAIATSVTESDKDDASSLVTINDEDDTEVGITASEKNSSLIKEENSKDDKVISSEKKTLSDTPKINNEKSKDKIEKKVSEVYESMDLNELIEYAWTGQERYKCLLCQFNGKNIVHHYKTNHPGQEIMISRLTFLDAKRAIDEAKDETFVKLFKKINSGPHRKFSCRFCVFNNEGVKKSAMESFYEHCSTHTGEYRFHCKNCGYQTISRSSMKPHYYKICRKNNGSFPTGIDQDAIPCEEYIPGYLCSVCNYIQLKECNTKKHIEDFHKNLSNVEVIKINMSTYLDVKDNTELNDSFDEAIAFKIESDFIAKSIEENSKIDINEKDDHHGDVEILDVNSDKTPESPLKPAESTSDTPQDEGDNSISNKLNAFVCPPELEDKDEEIQLERQKKMQEILDDIGIKLQKDSSNRRLSIIDTLKNKMTTNMKNSDCVRMELPENEVTTLFQDSNVNKLTDLPLSESEKLAINLDESKEPENSEVSTKNPTLEITPKSEEQEDKSDAETVVNSDKVEKKMKDPLALLHEDELKDDNSDREISDSETIANVSRSFESDSSDEMSENELSTDVNSLLEAAGTINTSTNVPMMTTIQRLAAQLQGVKNFPSVNNDDVNESAQEIINTPHDNPVDTPSMTTDSIEISKNNSSNPTENTQTADGPKNFIRLRRLSGDKLSNPESRPASRSSVSETPTASTNDNPLEIQPAKITQPETNEECSFLKIENVVSLAPNVLNTTSASPLLDDITKTVTTTSGKPIGVSLLKKPVGVLKKLRPVTSLEGLVGRLPVIPPAAAKCIKLSPIPIAPTPKNVKILKVVRDQSLFKQKDSGNISCAPKLKTVEAYANMLSASKLRHLYKCMGRSCTFSTDSVEEFGRHYQKHAESVDPKEKPPHDHETCPYCTEYLSTWESMRSHFKIKHTFCSFQCSYCFYRAFTQSYVELHQSTSHPGKPLSVILGMKDYHPAEMIDRREFIIPFICKHECNKLFYVPEAFITHLKTKHGPTLSIFKCHLCSASTLKSEQLVTHYKMHGIYKYQCLYCLFGSDAPMELHHHLSLMHFNRPPKILERSIPSPAARDKNVLLQLIIRNLDDTFKCSELKVIADTAIGDVNLIHRKKRKRIGANTTNDKEVAVSGNNPIKILPRPVTIVSHSDVFNLIDGNKSSQQPTNVFINLTDSLRSSGGIVKIGDATAIDILPKPPITIAFTEKSNNQNKDSVVANNPPITDSAIKQFTHHEPELELRYINEKFKSKIDNAIDPLSIPDNLNCSDEFININVLDNPEMLKSTEKSTTQNSNNQANNNIPDDNDDDSDIEILTHIQHTDDNSRNKSATKPSLSITEKSITTIEKQSNEELKIEVKSVKSEEKSSVTCSSGENSNTSNDVTTSAENVDVQNKTIVPLTLEEIKDTGFIGHDLYKCGYSNCTFNALLPVTLKNHIKQCSFANERKEIKCVHCGKNFAKIGNLLEHFKLHGIKRFGCSICNSRFAISYQAVSHIKFKHKVSSSKLIPADPTNPSADGLFVIHPHKGGTLQKYRGKKGNKSKTSDKKRGTAEKTTFSPADIDSLPRQAIYNHEVQCAVCPYTTKVRTNIIRHLQLHAKDETVPESGPVNPVPCLDKKERMFDKMVNLASSSHQNGRMGGTAKETVTPNEADGLPKYVPEQKRYVCGVADCNYLTVDETMLRYHSKALHPDEVNFRCPHCPSPSPGQETPQNIPIDKMGVHLKMHDTRLYKCSHCNHHHYHRHVVERHMTDKHSELRPYVKIIREVENTENINQPPAQEEPDEGPADRDGNYWKCNLCDYKCVYKSEIVTHAGSIHNEKCQFNCSMCPFKTTARISIEQHLMSKHVNDPDCSFTLSYERIKGPKPTSIAESNLIAEPFDTTPLWRRDMPRIRHIRGILLEEENETSSSTDTPTKSGKRKNDGEISGKPAKIKAVKLASLDGTSTLDNKGKSEAKGERIDNQAGATTEMELDSSNSTTVVSQLQEEATKPGSDANSDTTIGSRKIVFGNYGEPNGNWYVCSLCPNYRTRFRQDIKHHLYREWKYWRWHCKVCGFLTVSQSQINKHMNRQHKGSKSDYVAIKPNPEIENWVQAFLAKQSEIIRGATKKSQTPTADSSILRSSLTTNKGPCSPPTITLEDSDEVPVVESHNKIKKDSTESSLTKKIPVESTPPAIPLSTITTTETAKTVDLTAAISSLQAISNTNTSMDSDDNDDDGDALVIDSKDESIEENNGNINLEQIISRALDSSDVKDVSENMYVCKHCDMKFVRWRGFKLHVQVNHLKRLGFLCPYCDRSTNSETIMRQHIRTKHIGRPENIIHNPAAGGPELSDKFWEQEYGLIRPKKAKKRKMKQLSPNDLLDTSDDVDKTSTIETCTICGFTAMNGTGLKVHMRAHANKHTLKCVHCSFTTNSKSEVWQHSEINHPNIEWRAQEINSTGSSEGQTTYQYTKPVNEEDYNEDIEEEAIPETFEPKLIFNCFYCTLRSASVDSIKKHWAMIHKVHNESSEHKTGVPFRYKEIPVKTSSNHKLMKCAYCPKKGALTALRVHCRRKHPNLDLKFTEAIDKTQDIWVCKWCQESCEANARTAHHNMFHSHLPMRFKKEHDMQIIQKGYVCPECGFVSISLSRMKTHVAKHYDTFRCKRCDSTFTSIVSATQHSTQEHPGLSANIEGIATNIDLIMARVSETDCAGIVSNTHEKNQPTTSNDIFRNLGVAKKSTTKQLIRAASLPSVKSVARKSTHSLPRYPRGTVFRIDNITNNFDNSSGNNVGRSYYGLPREPVDLANLNTTMAVGGAQMKVKCNTLAQIINIDPRVMLTDIKKT